MIAAGTFREDLYFRINEIGVNLPPLRQRSQDSILIANALVRRFGEVYKRENIRLSSAALTAISNHSWPGNVRELENRVKRAVLMAREDAILPADLEIETAAGEEAFFTLKEARHHAEYELICKVLAAHGSNMTQVSKILGISRPTLYGLLATHGIKVEEAAEEAVKS